MPAAATRTPPLAGPMVPWSVRAIPIHALARTRSSGATRLGTTLRPAGANAVASSEAAATSTSSTGKGGSSAAMAP